MASETHQSLSSFKGPRLGDNPAVEQACETLDGLRCQDLLALLTVMTDTRVKETTAQSVLEGNRFHSPSEVSQQAFHQIEGHIFDVLPDTPFVELAPVQPFGTNTLIADTNIKNVVSALRRSEVLADATTALFRLAVNQLMGAPDTEDVVRLASNARLTRAQSFAADTNFVPHFKVFAQASVGRHGSPYGELELTTLGQHLASEVNILRSLMNDDALSASGIRIAVGNVALVESLIEQGRADRDTIRRNTINPDYDLLGDAGIDVPHEVPFDTPDLGILLRDHGFNKGVKVVEMMQAIMRRDLPHELPNITFDIARIAGIGYYKHMCYRIDAELPDQTLIPLGDGGTADWAQKVSVHKDIFTVTSGLGTEQIGRYLLVT